MKSLIIIALAAAVSLGNAQPAGERGAGQGRGEGFRKMLSLNDETVNKIQKLRDDHRKGQIALRAKLDAARVDFRALMRADAPDEKLAMAKQKEMSAVRAEMQAGRLTHRFAVAKLLTPEQRMQMKEKGNHRFGKGRSDGDECCDGGRPVKKHRRMGRHEMDGRYGPGND